MSASRQRPIKMQEVADPLVTFLSWLTHRSLMALVVGHKHQARRTVMHSCKPWLYIAFASKQSVPRLREGFASLLQLSYQCLSALCGTAGRAFRLELRAHRRAEMWAVTKSYLRNPT